MQELRKAESSQSEPGQPSQSEPGEELLREFLQELRQDLKKQTVFKAVDWLRKRRKAEKRCGDPAAARETKMQVKALYKYLKASESYVTGELDDFTLSELRKKADEINQ